jgi:predicted flap endonuclease-1-like 5' DNA nuclease
MPRFTDVQEACLAIARTSGLSSAQRTTEMLPVQTGTALPFAPESTAPYGAATAAQRKAVGRKVAAAKEAGTSGDEMRAIFGALLSGPARRKVLREHGLATPSTIARSYDAYRDGAERKGTQHAREHGAEAVARREAEEAAAAKKQRAADRRAARKAEREAAAAAASAE